LGGNRSKGRMLPRIALSLYVSTDFATAAAPLTSVLARFSVSSCIRIVVYLYAERVLQGKKYCTQKIVYKYLEIGWEVLAHMGRFSGGILRRLRCCFFATVLFV